MSSIKEVIMRRDGMSEDEADSLIEEAQEEIFSLMEKEGDLADMEQVVLDYFGLEPDYVEELLF